MDSQDGIYGKLFKVQTALRKVALKKDATNPFHASKYVQLPTLLNIVMPELEKEKVLLMQKPATIQLPDSIEPALTTVFYDTESGTSDESTMPLLSKAEDPQAQGSAITYARRYAIMSSLGLVGQDEDDDGQHATNTVQAAQENRPAPKSAKKEYPASDPQKKLMLNTVTKRGFTTEEAIDILCGMATVEDMDDITRAQASEIITELFKATKDSLAAYLQTNGEES